MKNKGERDMDPMRTKLEAYARQLQVALEDFVKLVHDPDVGVSELERAQRKITKMTTEQTRMVIELQLTSSIKTSDGSKRASASKTRTDGNSGLRPFREEVLDVLAELGVPAQPRLVSEIAAIRYGSKLQVERFSSLRRDEERAYLHNSAARPVWVVPAINCVGLTAYPRIISSSAWPLEERLIGSLTLRANHLRTLLALMQMWERSSERSDESSAEALRAMILRFASSVPGALEHGTFTTAFRVVSATQQELAVFYTTDQQERQTAASQLAAYAERFQLWGRPESIEGDYRRRSSDVS
jgi:hypothetical protein